VSNGASLQQQQQQQNNSGLTSLQTKDVDIVFISKQQRMNTQNNQNQ